MDYLLDKEFKYTPSSKTNVAETLRRLGFQPPSQTKEHQKKCEIYRSLGVRDLIGGQK
jgi:hypothetical protein